MDTDQDLDLGQPTRMLFLGDERLADGFRLIGFEAHADPDPQQVDQILRTLLRDRQKAFVVVDDAIMRQDIPNLQRVRREGGRIVVIAIPALGTSPRLSSEVAQRLSALFGSATLQSEERS